ncbi:MAG: peptide-methionine (S)-S-oxide reductase MsrA [Myxococcota bacterium]
MHSYPGQPSSARPRATALAGAAAIAALAGVLATACTSSNNKALPAKAASLPDPAVDLPAASGTQYAVFASGCFWCTEAVFEEVEGVGDVTSGYAGGSAQNANYSAVVGGETKHAEAVRVPYDPSLVSYGTLLRVFFTTHDPTQVNRQGPDVGPQYRSAIFYANDEEKRVARAYIDQLSQSGLFTKPIATTLEPLVKFHAAESYHQDYAKRNPDKAYIRINAQPKVDKLHKELPEVTGSPAPAKRSE